MNTPALLWLTPLALLYYHANTLSCPLTTTLYLIWLTILIKLTKNTHGGIDGSPF